MNAKQRRKRRRAAMTWSTRDHHGELYGQPVRFHEWRGVPMQIGGSPNWDAIFANLRRRHAL